MYMHAMSALSRTGALHARQGTVPMDMHPSAQAGEGSPAPALGWLALDGIDYGIVVVNREGGVLHANRRARTELKAANHALVLAEGRLKARYNRDIPLFTEALDAVGRGLRRLIEMDPCGERINVALMPLSASTGEVPTATMVVIGRRHLCENLSVQSFARANDLTLAETRVLEALCAGETARALACRQGVAVSTVRTHIASIRMKTGTRSLQELVRRVAALPPLVSVLRMSE